MQVLFSQRAASTQWEPLAISRLPGLSVWAWFRPQQAPSGLTVGIPPELCQSYPTGLPLTVADLLHSAGVALPQFQAVSLYGGPWQPAAAFGPYLNHPVPLPGGDGGNEIGLLVMEQAAASPAHIPGHVPGPPGVPGYGQPPMSGYAEQGYQGFPEHTDFHDAEPPPANAAQMYDRIESSWKSAVQMERQLTGVRQKLSGMLNSLNKLDRELTPEERLSADREDKDNWEEARRWARDLAAKCHREIKQFDIGMTSAAGRKNAMQAFFEQVIEPRQPCNDLETYRREFETYRKDMVNLQRAMTSAAQAATQNGTQRSQRVLSSIGKKIRERRRRMREPVGGTNMDRSCRRKS